MQALCASLIASEFSFAARARIGVEYSSSSQRMPVIRLDRHGLIASVADDVGLPPLWLPQPARVLSGGETLCELRLVARALARPGGRPLELTMQPSRADDDLSFWQALHARRHLYSDMTGAADYRRSGAASGPFSREPMHSDVGCEAIFELQDGNKAAFFSEWLEYHFAEISALARATSCPADLRDIDRHRTGTQVTVMFSYRRASRATQHTTDAVCTWVAREMERLFGVSLRYELPDAHECMTLADRCLRSPPFVS